MSDATNLSPSMDDLYTNIRGYASRYKSLLQLAGHGLDPNTQYGDETLAVLMDKESLDKLFNLSDTLAAIIGVHNGRATVAMLAYDPATGQIKPEHINSNEPGQQVWPFVKVEQLQSFLP